MGSDVEVIVIDGPAASLAHARDRLDELERRWSRFLPDSEVSRLTAHAGCPVEVHPDTVTLVRTAIAAWRESGGAVNPTVLGAVIRAGYDRDFAEVAPLAERVAVPACGLGLVACTDIELDGTAVTLPAGTGFDPGGIGKGLAADVVVDELRSLGAAGACVNVGGDLRVSGTGPEGGAWTIAIEDPADPARHLLRVGVAEGAVATSTTARRRWRIGGVPEHHLIDPATGEPSTTDLVQATALAASCWLAETYAKAVLLRGQRRAFDVLPAAIAALAVGEDGTVLSTPALRGHTGTAAPPTHLVAKEPR